MAYLGGLAYREKDQHIPYHATAASVVLFSSEDTRTARIYDTLCSRRLQRFDGSGETKGRGSTSTCMSLRFARRRLRRLLATSELVPTHCF
ncbi:hypothetical protein PLICRDRAFT_35691 [Plicaturopsis crispa FD-325 SS-3]|nr:hypothetical protein PLICRDRAFT_35691 [Plicaturopsis crispa FD-325 SS-3]